MKVYEFVEKVPYSQKFNNECRGAFINDITILGEAGGKKNVTK